MFRFLKQMLKRKRVSRRIILVEVEANLAQRLGVPVAAGATTRVKREDDYEVLSIRLEHKFVKKDYVKTLWHELTHALDRRFGGATVESEALAEMVALTLHGWSPDMVIAFFDPSGWWYLGNKEPKWNKVIEYAGEILEQFQSLYQKVADFYAKYNDELKAGTHGIAIMVDFETGSTGVELYEK